MCDQAAALQPLIRYGPASVQPAPPPAVVSEAVAELHIQANRLGHLPQIFRQPIPSHPIHQQPHQTPQQPLQPLPQPPQPPQQPPIPPGCSRIIEPVVPYELGPMSVVCPDCNAIHWKAEHL